MKLQQKKSKTFSNYTGSLTPFYINQSFNDFKIKRFFFVYGNQKHFRADHAHKKCNQILIPVNGKIEVQITTKRGKEKKFRLSHKLNNYLVVPKLNWIRLKFIDRNSILLTFCDYRYDKNEYIQSFSKFIKN